MKQTAKRTTTITVDLGELKAPWQAWCQAHGITPSHALRNVLRQAMDRRATRAPAPRLRVTPKQERANARMEVNLTPSELAALKRMAGHEGYVPTKWVVVSRGIQFSPVRGTKIPRLGYVAVDASSTRTSPALSFSLSR